MTDLLRITMRGADALKSLFKRIPDGSKQIALEEFAKYVVGNDSHGLKHYPAPLPDSTYVRTYNLKNSWNYTVQQPTAYITNQMYYAPFVQGQPPARHMARRGWRGHMDVIASNMTGGIRMATFAVLRWIKGQM